MNRFSFVPVLSTVASRGLPRHLARAENAIHARLGVVAAALLVASAGAADTRLIDFGRFPNGNLIPNATVLTTQLSGYGVLLGARRSSESVGQQGSVNVVSYSYGSTACTRYWFLSPDVFGATAIFTFVDPQTGAFIDATSFEFAPDFDSNTESIDIAGLDASNQVVAFATFNNTCGRCTPKLTLSGVFRKVEIRTHGNPGIGFGNCYGDGTLRVGYTPCLSISTQPIARSVCAGGVADLSIQALSGALVTYEWQVDDLGAWKKIADGPITIGGASFGAAIDTSTSVLRVQTQRSYSALTSATFRCLVTNECASRTSDAVVVRVCRSDLNCDGQVDDADFEWFVVGYNLLLCDDPTMPLACPGDLDGDGLVADSDFQVFVVAYDKVLCE